MHTSLLPHIGKAWSKIWWPMIYEIHRYPVDMIDVVRLASGERVVIRPVLPQDEELTTAFFRGLSALARHNRFMAGVHQLPPELMRRLVQVDYANHLALVAELFADGRETVVAEARFVRGADPIFAEFAVSVAEPWQGKRLANSPAWQARVSRRCRGVRRMVGQTLASNAPMLALAHKAGFTILPSTEVRGVMLLERQLASPTPGGICFGAGARAVAA
jgi:RimJ/RimL family protein N-acetyltransferase